MWVAEQRDDPLGSERVSAGGALRVRADPSRQGCSVPRPRNALGLLYSHHYVTPAAPLTSGACRSFSGVTPGTGSGRRRDTAMYEISTAAAFAARDRYLAWMASLTPDQRAEYRARLRAKKAAREEQRRIERDAWHARIAGR